MFLKSVSIPFTDIFLISLLDTWLAIFKVATDCSLSLTTAWVQILTAACEKVASDLLLGCSFCLVLPFPQPVTTGSSRFSLYMAEKSLQ